MVNSLWNETKASQLSQGVDELVYRSNLIGTDRAVCNWGGGNTSVKTFEKDFRGRDIEVMWVKGSGSDLATMKAQNFTGLRMEDIRLLMEREEMSDEEMVEYLAHCMIDSKHPRASIETLLHAFYLLNMWIIHIQMPLLVFAAHIMEDKLRRRFTAIVSFGFRMCDLDLRYLK